MKKKTIYQKRFLFMVIEIKDNKNQCTRTAVMSSTKTAFLLQIVKNVTIKNVLKKRCYIISNEKKLITKLN